VRIQVFGYQRLIHENAPVDRFKKDGTDGKSDRGLCTGADLDRSGTVDRADVEKFAGYLMGGEG
jgi:hypothetical protein